MKNARAKWKDFIDRLKVLWWLSEHYWESRKGDFNYLDNSIKKLHNRLGEHTTVHMDIGHRNIHQVIVIGKYQHNDYIRAFNVEAESLPRLIEILHGIEKNAKIGRVDMSPNLIPFSTVYRKDRL